MNAIQQRCRPKHQVLVLKCYPRTTKGAVDVKPNSSELSYLLFYATSRRSKIQKVGQFLEKKTASDVWRVRIGNVQVTLQILAALIEKAPKDLPLFAQNVLKILDLVLRSNDITMVEASLPTFRTFCEHHDVSSLFADQAYLRQYEQVVRAYATFASTRKAPSRTTTSKPVALRWRNAGLEAIKSVAESDALSSVAGRQLDVIVPMILENLWTDNEEFLNILLQRVQMEEKVDSNALLRRRTSISTVRTADTGGDANPIAISGSSVDIDKLAEEDIGVMAMQCLKQIFVIPNRAQINGATASLLQFIKERVQQKETVVVETQDSKGRDHGWAIKIFEFVARWAPVQDRYVIMITTTDILLKTPPTDENVAEQIVLTAIIGSLLSSDINLIGLSVMDVLLGLIQHMKRVLKHSGSSRGSSGPATASGDEKPPVPDITQHISPPYRDLLTRIQQSIGHLATHVYYADQISDMVSTILLRLKPHPSTSTANSSPPAEKAEAIPGASTGNVSDDQSHLDSFFALDLAKTIALQAIKSILLVANPQTKISGNVNLTRNKVPIQVWEGTHWLLRDPDGQVRKAYVDTLSTWLDRETARSDLEARDDVALKSSPKSKNKESPTSVARRAVSSASNREKSGKARRCRFLQLIHLAIYDNALQYIEFEADIALLHILLTKLVTKLGVNAARYGLPMIFRLQEDILEAETPASKVHLGCLCHGYFWALSEHFEFEGTPVGRAVHNEIVRRRSKQFWVEGVHVPTPSIETLGTPGVARQHTKMPTHEVESEALLPFDDRITMIDCICANYKDRTISPPSSPPASPGRVFAHPVLTSGLSTIPRADDELELPEKFREEMSTEWNREAAVIALQAESKSASLNGSKTGTTTTKGNHLTVNGLTANGHTSSRPESAYARQSNLRPQSHASQVAVLRNSSVQSHGSGRSASSRGFVASVDQLKSVLTGDPVRPATFQTLKEDEDSSDSMASYDFTPSELSFNPDRADGDNYDAVLARSRSKSRERKSSGDSGGPLTSHPTEGETEDGEEVPPVPPLPAALAGKSPPPEVGLAKVSSKDHAVNTPKRNIRSRGGDSILSSNFANAGAASMDLQAMLKGIDSKSKQNTIGNLTRPPY
ncbi:uncharacterized protein F4822DRAFT_111526 [Hypoxylon trugodes]|uniref:uncharacterized protein n=1 Tax=Hypoxylon trugodes TaxID=326681 RepID=UPI0021A07016|nr:uncharacterized protein F4822DRAFT_111526 [Hypoxylon trugodes]KAI1391986.1 hypothetical protein F4822DRAFT_111526 [Hypoxylon trugodes]